VDWAIYSALFVGAAAVVGAAAFLVVRSLQAWRTLKRFRRHLGHSLGDLAASAEHTGVVVDRVSDQQQLEASLARLRIGLARFNVLRASVDEVNRSLTRITSVYPRK